MSKVKILRATTIASTMNVILKGQLHYLSHFFDIIGATSPFADYFDEISKRENILLFGIDFERKIALPKDIKALIQLIRLILNEKPTIIHAQTPKAVLLSMIAGFLCRTPIRMAAVAGMPVISGKGMMARLLRLTDYIAYSCATGIYPNSLGLKAYLEVSLPSRLQKKIRFIGNGSSNGVDFSHFSSDSVSEASKLALKKELSFSKDNFIFCFVGRVVNDKGVRELLNAFSKIIKEDRFKEARLLIVGPLRDSDDPIPLFYQNMLHEHSSIKYVGLQKDIRPYLAISDAFVFPSYREGLPGSLIQAGAMGLPLLASRIVGNTEIIENGGGLLFDVRSSDDIVNAMERIHEDEVLRSNLRANVRMKLRSFYDQPIYWEALKNEYNHLIEKYL